MASGGWDVTFCFDPKLSVEGIDGPEGSENPDDPDDREVVETINGHPLVINPVKRPSVARFFEAWGHRVDIVNGLWVGAIGHDTAMVRMMTGTPDDTRPDVAVIAGAELGAELPLGCIDLGGRSYAGSLASTAGTIGSRSQLKMLLDDTVAFPAPADAGFTYPLLERTDDERALLQEFLAGRIEREASAVRGISHRRERLFADMFESNSRVERFQADSGAFAELLGFGLAPSFERSASMAVELLRGGVCQTVVMDSSQNWDSHTDFTEQHATFDTFFLGLHGMMDLLELQGMLETTTVAVVSEMTRTPKSNVRGGKDHWPYTSAMLFGAGVRGGRTLGGTDDTLVPRKVSLQTGELSDGGAVCRYDNFCAGLLETVGVDPQPWFPDVEVYRGFQS